MTPPRTFGSLYHAMSTFMTADRKTARKKGMTAAAVAGGAFGIILLGAPVLGGLGLVGAGYLTYDWFMYRAKRGMRF